MNLRKTGNSWETSCNGGSLSKSSTVDFWDDTSRFAERSWQGNGAVGSGAGHARTSRTWWWRTKNHWWRLTDGRQLSTSAAVAVIWRLWTSRWQHTHKLIVHVVHQIHMTTTIRQYLSLKYWQTLSLSSKVSLWHCCEKGKVIKTVKECNVDRAQIDCRLLNCYITLIAISWC